MIPYNTASVVRNVINDNAITVKSTPSKILPIFHPGNLCCISLPKMSVPPVVLPCTNTMPIPIPYNAAPKILASISLSVTAGTYEKTSINATKEPMPNNVFATNFQPKQTRLIRSKIILIKAFARDGFSPMV